MISFTVLWGYGGLFTLAEEDVTGAFATDVMLMPKKPSYLTTYKSRIKFSRLGGFKAKCLISSLFLGLKVIMDS